MLNLWGEEEALPEPEPPKPVLTPAERAVLERVRATQRAQERKEAGNPLIAQYGPGPEGRMCRDCVHFLRVHYHSRNYFKCDLRRITHGAGSDHKSRWPACARFEPGEGKSHDLDR